MKCFVLYIELLTYRIWTILVRVIYKYISGWFIENRNFYQMGPFCCKKRFNPIYETSWSKHAIIIAVSYISKGGGHLFILHDSKKNGFCFFLCLPTAASCDYVNNLFYES